MYYKLTITYYNILLYIIMYTIIVIIVQNVIYFVYFLIRQVEHKQVAITKTHN